MSSKINVYIQKIIKETGLTPKEIQDLVEEKKEELKGLISEEGALFVVAKELGVDVKEESQEIIKDIEINTSGISSNMKNITIIGRIKEIDEIRSFPKNDGTTGYVGSFILQDNEGEIKVILWNDIVEIVNDEHFQINEVVKILNANAKLGREGNIEIHLGNYSKIQIAPVDIDYKKYSKVKFKCTLINKISLKQQSISLKGKVINKFPLKEFERKTGDIGRVQSILLMDGSGSVKITFWDDDIRNIENLKEGDSIKITGLKPKLNTYETGSIDIYAGFSTKITILKEGLNFKTQKLENINILQSKTGIVSFEGIITSVDNLRNITTKSGEELSLINFNVSDDTGTIRVTLWREVAEKYAEELKVGKGISLQNVIVKFSSYSQKNEASFNKISKLEFKELDLNIFKEEDIDKSELKAFDKIEILQSKTGIVSFEGIITSVDNLRNITTKSGEELSLINFNVSDDTGTIRVTLWREAAEKYAGELKVGKGISLQNVMVKFSSYSQKNEASFNKTSHLEFKEIKLDNLVTSELPKREINQNFTNNYTRISDIKSSEVIEIKGFIVKELTRISFYEACSGCQRKTNYLAYKQETGNIAVNNGNLTNEYINWKEKKELIDNCTCEEKKGNSQYRMILNIIVDDGTGTIRCTFGGEVAERLLGHTAEEVYKIKDSSEFSIYLEERSKDICGRDLQIRGKTKYSNYTSSYELGVYDFKDLNINDELERVMKEIET
ncbi:MAG: DUF2240 family protein [Promethearchaeota archaeon]